MNSSTFIIPVYNGESYIARCIDSILDNKLSDYEIIIIDDGSIDQTSMICQKYTEKFDEIIYIKQLNKGVSAARNLGIATASKDYIFFVDADDYLTRIHRDRCKLGNADIVIFDYYLNDVNSTVSIFSKDTNSISKKSMLKKYLLTDIFNSVWGKAFRRKFIQDNNILFPVGMKMGEDAVFMGKCISNAEKLHYVNNPFYVYLKNTDSVSSKAVTSFTDQEQLILYKKRILEENTPEDTYQFGKKTFGDVMSSLRSQTKTFVDFKQLINNLKNHRSLYVYLKSDSNYYGIRKKIQRLLLQRKWYFLLYIELKFENWRIRLK